MGFAQAVTSGLRNFYNPYGRASRSEFWWYWVFIFLLTSFFGVTGGFVSGAGGREQTFLGVIFDVIGLVLGISMVCAQIRRLHDIGKSGWNVCWSFLPVIGGIYLIILWCRPSQPGANQYGEEPV